MISVLGSHFFYTKIKILFTLSFPQTIYSFLFFIFTVLSGAISSEQ